MTTRAYVRVSSSRQAEEGLSLDAQIERLRSAAPDGEFVIYREEGVSGRRASRPQLDRLMADVQAGDTVMVVALDRFGRSATNVALNVREIGERGAQFVSLREQIDTTSAAGRFFFTVMAALAELESELIGERVRATRPAAKRKHGKSFGGIRPFGREPDGAIRHAEAKVLRERIVAPYLAGIPLREIARDLVTDGIATANGGSWRGTGVAKMLRRPDLAGLVEIDGELVEGTLTPIIDKETWHQVQGRFATRATGIDTRGRHPAAPYLLQAPLDCRCGICGSRLRPRTVHRKGRPTLFRYVCVNRETGGSCTFSRTPRESLDPALVALFRQDLLDEKATLKSIEKAARAVIRDVERSLGDAEREAKLAEERMARVRQHFADGAISAEDWRDFREELGSQREAALAEVERLRAHRAELEDETPLREAQRALHALLDDLRRLADRYEPGDGELVRSLRMALATVIETVYVSPFGAPSAPRPDTGRSVFLVQDGMLVEIVVRETAPHEVTTADGKTFIQAGLPHLERVPLVLADKSHFSSLIGSISVRLLEALVRA